MAFSKTRPLLALMTAAVFTLGLFPKPAFAQGINVTQAEVMFKQGQDLIKQGKIHEACERFAASNKLDSTVNTIVALAACHDKEGKTATAWGEYQEAGKKGRGTDAGSYADGKANEIFPRLLKIKIEMNLVPQDVKVKIDNGPEYGKEILGGDLPLDPGDHVIDINAEGKRPWSNHIKLAQDNSPLAVKVSLEDIPPEELKKIKDQQNGVIIREEEVPQSPIRTAGIFTMIGGGVALLGAGVSQILALAVFDANARKLKDPTRQGGGCPNGVIPPTKEEAQAVNQNCLDAYNNQQNAKMMQSVAITLAIVGGLALIGGIVMYVVGAPSKKTETTTTTKTGWKFTPAFSPGYAGGVLEATF